MAAAHHQTRAMAEELALHRDLLAFDAARTSMEQVFLKVYGHAAGEGVAA